MLVLTACECWRPPTIDRWAGDLSCDLCLLLLNSLRGTCSRDRYDLDDVSLSTYDSVDATKAAAARNEDVKGLPASIHPQLVTDNNRHTHTCESLVPRYIRSRLTWDWHQEQQEADIFFNKIPRNPSSLSPNRLVYISRRDSFAANQRWRESSRHSPHSPVRKRSR